MFQIIVSVMPIAFDPFNGPKTNRPFSWVSAQGAELDQILATLMRHASKDMKFTDVDNNEMVKIVSLCWDRQFKNIMSKLNDEEFINVAILDEAELAQREKELNALLGLADGIAPSGSTVH